jgi:hypothetical protein
MIQSGGKGFSFPELQTHFDPRFKGALADKAFFLQHIPDDQLVTIMERESEGVDLYMYHINWPLFDYWIWDMMKEQVLRMTRDWSSSSPRDFFVMNPDLDFDAGGDTNEKVLALFEKIRFLLLSMVAVDGWVKNGYLWASTQGWATSERVQSIFKTNTIRTLCNQLNGIPYNSAFSKYLLNQQRALVFDVRPGKMCIALPLYMYEMGAPWMEDRGDGAANKKGNTWFSPNFNQIVGSEIGDLSAKFHTDTYGWLANHLYNSVLRARNYVFQILSFKRDILDIGTKLKDFLGATGIFDIEWNHEQVLQDINNTMPKQGWEFVKQCMIFANRPGAVYKHLDEAKDETSIFLYSPTTWATPGQTSKFKIDPIDYVREANVTAATRNTQPNATDGCVGPSEVYEYVKVLDATALSDMAALMDVNDWGSADAGNSHEVETVLADDFPAFGTDLLELVLEEWFSDGHSFYVPDEQFFERLYDQTPTERGALMFNIDEYNEGALIPRFVHIPTINYFDPFQCGFSKVLIKERADKYWHAWALTYDSVPVGATSKPWALLAATMLDCPCYVGAAIGLSPEYATHHYLAAQGSFYGDDALVDTLTALESYSPVPFTPFCYAWFHDSVAFTTTGWDDAAWVWDADAQCVAYANPRTISNSARQQLWISLEYWDPFRPYKVKIANLIQYGASMFKKYRENVVMNWDALLTNVVVPDYPLDKDVLRYFSPYKQKALSRLPTPVSPSESELENKMAARSRSRNQPSTGAEISGWGWYSREFMQFISSPLKNSVEAVAFTKDPEKVKGYVSKKLGSEAYAILIERLPSPKDWAFYFSKNGYGVNKIRRDLRAWKLGRGGVPGSPGPSDR